MAVAEVDINADMKGIGELEMGASDADSGTVAERDGETLAETDGLADADADAA